MSFSYQEMKSDVSGLKKDALIKVSALVFLMNRHLCESG